MSDILNKIETHLNNIDAMKADIKTDIETIFNKLNIKNLINQPSNIIDAAIFAIIERITKKYIKPAYKESQRYVKSVLKD